ncbi:hypothetical protein AB0N59_04235 [Microbacterium sp. NPDC089321]|uniref:hypothetical protein n=1 Tax=Microbacterium sp. NPDC089321 TaxID=3155183 RepID=UPI00341D2FB6
MRFASADRRSLWLWCVLGVFAWLMLASILGAAQASAAERPDAAPGASASAAAQQRAPHSDEGARAPGERAARTVDPPAAAAAVQKAAAPAGKASTSAKKAAAPVKSAAAPIQKAAAAQKATAPVQKDAAPDKKAAPVQKAAAKVAKAAPVKNAAAKVDKAAPVKNAAAAVEKAAAPDKKAAAAAKKAASSSALGSAVAALPGIPRGAVEAEKNRHALPAQKIDRAASLQAAAPGERQNHAQEAALAPRGHATTHAVSVSTHRAPKAYSASSTSAAAPAAAATVAPAIAAEPAPVDGQVPGLALSAAASSGCAAASGASSILSLAGEVTGLASRDGLIRLASFADAADRPLAGPAATTDCRPD